MLKGLWRLRGSHRRWIRTLVCLCLLWRSENQPQCAKRQLIWKERRVEFWWVLGTAYWLRKYWTVDNRDWIRCGRPYCTYWSSKVRSYQSLKYDLRNRFRIKGTFLKCDCSFNAEFLAIKGQFYLAACDRDVAMLKPANTLLALICLPLGVRCFLIWSPRDELTNSFRNDFCWAYVAKSQLDLSF